MAYKIACKQSVAKDLARLGKPEAKRLLDRIAKVLPRQADQHPLLKGEFAGLRKCRIGDDRVIFALIGNEVQILRVVNRKDVYR